MDMRRKVEHNFNLNGMKPGDWFFGCNVCSRTQYPANTAMSPNNYCKFCHHRLDIFHVTKDDFPEPKP